MLNLKRGCKQVRRHRLVLASSGEELWKPALRSFLLKQSKSTALALPDALCLAEQRIQEKLVPKTLYVWVGAAEAA